MNHPRSCLTEEDIAETETARRNVQSLELEMPFAAAHFPLNKLAVKRNHVSGRLENGSERYARVERGGISMRIAA